MFLLLLSACATAPPWERLNTRVLECRPFQVITFRTSYETSAIAGHVYAQGHDDAPLSGVRIVLRELGRPDIVTETATAADGSFALAAQADGWYQLETCREGFDSVVVPVRVVRRARVTDIPLYLPLSA
ncbi:MAG TPA: carboxypeptidase-like regulatory domain-containing protein [Thermoanaerobaculia bacterium]